MTVGWRAPEESDGLVDRNVAPLVASPRAERPEMITWTVAELKQFLRSVEGHRMHVGHSSIAVTIDLYSHAVPGRQRGAAAVMGDLILGWRNGDAAGDGRRFDASSCTYGES